MSILTAIPAYEAERARQAADQDDGYWDYDDNDCANCGGEGFTYGCSWDWQCDTYDEGEGTCLCTRRCEWCTPLTDAELAERAKLNAILLKALSESEGEA